MIGMPHLFVLQQIKRSMQFLRSNPDHIGVALEGYIVDTGVKSIFGVRRIDEAIEWIQKNEFHYATAYSLDSDKFPSINVQFNGGAESKLSLGDESGMVYAGSSLNPTVYAKGLRFKNITDERTYEEKTNTKSPVTKYGYPIVPKGIDIRNRVYRYLTLTNGTISFKITGFSTDGTDDILVLDKTMTDLQWRDSVWTVQNTFTQQNYTVNTSFDRVSIDVQLKMTGDPEITEMIGCLIRYILKQSRRPLINLGLQNPTFSHSGLKYVKMQNNPTFILQYSITGEYIDTWLDVPIMPVDYLSVDLEVAEDYNSSADSVITYSFD
jgi:hypothetical protein